jgi:hypothetical protein
VRVDDVADNVCQTLSAGVLGGAPLVRAVVRITNPLDAPAERLGMSPAFQAWVHAYQPCMAGAECLPLEGSLVHGRVSNLSLSSKLTHPRAIPTKGFTDRTAGS